MGVGYLYGNGGGGTGAILTVTAPDGATVSVSKDGKVKRKTVNTQGLAVFKGLETGTWTLSITDGVQTASCPVTINADYNATIAFFSATINITYSAGSICTCTDGTTTLTAPDTSGTWACVVPNTGVWTIKITDGISTTSTEVTITTDGQSESITLAYGVLYENGNQYESNTGGWKAVDDDGGKGRVKFNTNNITISNKSAYETDTIYTTNKMDLTGFKTINAVVTVSGSNSDSNLGVYVGIASKNNNHRAYENCSLAHKKSKSSGTITCDISSIDSGYPFVCCDETNVTITKIYLE